MLSRLQKISRWEVLLYQHGPFFAAFPYKREGWLVQTPLVTKLYDHYKLDRMSAYNGSPTLVNTLSAAIQKAKESGTLATLDQTSRDVQSCWLICKLINSINLLKDTHDQNALTLFHTTINRPIKDYYHSTPWYKRIDWPYFWRLNQQALQIKQSQELADNISLMLTAAESKPEDNYLEAGIQESKQTSPEKIRAQFQEVYQLQPSKKIKTAVSHLEAFMSPYLKILDHVQPIITHMENKENEEFEKEIRKEREKSFKRQAAMAAKSINNTTAGFTLNKARDIILEKARTLAKKETIAEHHLQKAYRNLSLQFHPSSARNIQKKLSPEQCNILGEQFKLLTKALEELKAELPSVNILSSWHSVSQSPPSAQYTPQATHCPTP
ncbi:MAG: hypothetical protein WC748_05235 [Legionellales bacterium]|jgi:hypothetical protein